MLAVILLLACGPPPAAPPLAPVAVGDQVAMRLTEASLVRQSGDLEAAVAAWEDAHAAFESELEGRLRIRCGDRCTTELEYGFARLRQALETDDRDAVAIADELGLRIQDAASTLPEIEPEAEEDP